LISGRGRDFSLLNSIWNSSGAHPYSYPVGIGVLSLEVKCWLMTAHLHQVRRIKMFETLPALLLVWCLISIGIILITIMCTQIKGQLRMTMEIIYLVARSFAQFWSSNR
jgi:hypothetical protein